MANTTHDTERHTDAASRWESRRALAWVLRIILFAAPILASVVFVLVASRHVDKPPGLGGTVAWWVGITAAATLVLRLVDRSLQRFVPVVALLKLSLVFPDQAPSRFRLALRRGTVKQFERELQAGNLANTPQLAAEMLLTLAGRLGHHDRLTRGHSERVRAYSALIAEEMGLKQSERDLLQWAALLHDIGKLDVPPELLNKDGRPTDEEWAVIREHPARSSLHLAPLAGWLGEWRLAASQHHERWDGDGYPFGLAGEDISLAGRIVAVADAYDTITSVRSYKSAATAEQGRAEVARCAGTQFDPAVVKAFLAVSVSRLRGIMGPLSWLASAPILASVPTAATPTLTSTLTASAAVATMGVAGIAVPPPELPLEPEVAVVETLPELELAFAEPTPDRRPIDLPAFELPTPTPEPPAPTETPDGPALTLELPTSTPAPAGPDPTSTPVPAPTATPPPGATPTPTSTPQPTATPEPTPTPTATATPTATPPPAESILLFLENPGSGNTASSAVLPFTITPPVDWMYNFDTERNSDEGLTLKRSNSGLAETDPEKIQIWATDLAGTSVSGVAAVELWAAPKDYDWDDDEPEHWVTVGLQQCNAALSACTTLATATAPIERIGSPWFSPVNIGLGNVTATFDAANPYLVLRVVNPSSSQSRIWLAYDTFWEQSHVKIGS